METRNKKRNGRNETQDAQLSLLHKQIEQAKLEWEATVDSLAQLVCLLDQNGFILRANRTVEHWELEDVTKVAGMTMHRLLHGEECPHSACYWEPFWERAWSNLLDQQATDFEFKDSVLDRYIRIQLQPVTAPEETAAKRQLSDNVKAGISFASLVIEDITAQKQVDEAMLRTQKLESLGVLAGGVAHDFNNLLTGILTECTLALMKLPENVPARDNIEKAMQAGERAATVTRQLLAYSGKGNFQETLIDLNELILENLSFLTASISSLVVLEADLEPVLGLIRADSGQLQQVIMNLILNASEAYEGQSGTVSIRTKMVQLDGNYKTRYGQNLSEGEYICLTVSDTGKGIREQILSQIFDPFFTTKFTGKGLGLAAVLGVVRAHGGDIQVTSKPGEGTTFTVYLPISS